MENARLITETREALEQQTATSEVLQVINSSPGDVAPVFEAILEKAHSLCGATLGALLSYDGDQFRALATHGLPAEFAAIIREPFRLHPKTPMMRVAHGAGPTQVPDLLELLPQLPFDDRMGHAAIEIAGIRTLLMVPLRKDGALLGIITANRQEVRPFSEKEVALLENFAAQAVIAMENARLISETREALDQQTATAEVLQVINSSPGDLAPVFDAMLTKVTSLCEASFGILWIFDGEFARAGALHQVPEAYAELCRAPFRPSPGSGPARMMQGEDSFAIADLTAYPPYQAGDPLTRAIVDLGGARSVVIAPLRRDDITLGAITIYQQQLRPFTDKQIALLQNFAAQAVIAMENARLISETREALDQQTATAEVLQVINSSPGDLAPVFDAMLDKALRLCEAAFGHLLTFDGESPPQSRTRPPWKKSAICR
jgi:GAF domain-containing protein